MSQSRRALQVVVGLLLIASAIYVVVPFPKRDHVLKHAMDPLKVPEPLRQFVPLFEKWGATESDSARYELADRALANPEEMKELREFCARLRETYARLPPEVQASCQAWENGSIVNDRERAKVYFTFLLFDELGFKLD